MRFNRCLCVCVWYSCRNGSIECTENQNIIYLGRLMAKGSSTWKDGTILISTKYLWKKMAMAMATATTKTTINLNRIRSTAINGLRQIQKNNEFKKKRRKQRVPHQKSPTHGIFLFGISTVSNAHGKCIWNVCFGCFDSQKWMHLLTKASACPYITGVRWHCVYDIYTAYRGYSDLKSLHSLTMCIVAVVVAVAVAIALSSKYTFFIT